MSLNIYTAQYNYKGNDRLDVTVKGLDPLGKVFAPTWGMVNGFANGTMSKERYEHLYNTLMRQSYRLCRDEWEDVLDMDIITLVCFCKSGKFCHRLLLAEYLEKCGAIYHGER